MDVLVLDELGYLPFSKNGGQLIFHLLSNWTLDKIGCTCWVNFQRLLTYDEVNKVLLARSIKK